MSHPAGLPLTAANPREEPAMQPPPGEEAHVTNRSDEQRFFYLCITVATVVPGVLLLIRLYTKAKLMKKVELSDSPTKQVNPVMFVTARVMIVVILVYYTISTCITTFACNPRERIWNPLITEYQCLDNTIGILFTCLFNIVSDLIILALPSRAVWKLKIPLKKRISIILLFATGLFACIANAVMIVYVLRMSGDHADVTYNTAWAGFWLLAEISLATIVTCLISLPKFVEVHGKWFRTAFSNLSRPLIISLTRLGGSSSSSEPRSFSSSSGRFNTKDTTVSADLLPSSSSHHGGVVVVNDGRQNNGSAARLVSSTGGWNNDSPYALRDNVVVSPAVVYHHQGANHPNKKTIQVQTRVEVEFAK
ncbi:MAG: hypothetical protein LQ341_007264 [Variospora aurantia]|nr:MAG: hypothetical protein LQ341_007264 [Variospora aurantia]